MKDEDIKLPNMPFSLVNSPSYNNDIEEYARQAVRMNMPASKPSAPEPFDLARAKAGEPIVTRDGRKARFLAHVPEFEDEGARVLVLVDGDKWVSHYFETGSYGWQEGIKDLFMAPKPKRTVWVNVWRVSSGFGATAHVSESDAKLSANKNTITITHPIEIDATE